MAKPPDETMPSRDLPDGKSGAAPAGPTLAARCSRWLRLTGALVRIGQNVNTPPPGLFLQGCESKTHSPTAVRKHVKINVMLKQRLVID